MVKVKCMRSNTYIWVTGLDARGVLTTAGPYESEADAEESTGHLSQVDFHVLSTRDHIKARKVLRKRLQGRGRQHRPQTAGEDVPTERSNMFDRLRGMMRNREEDELGR